MRQRFDRVVKAFAGLPLERKLSIFFLPVFAALAGTLIARYLGDGNGPAPREENLEVVDLVPRNSPDQEPLTAELRVLVRNTGNVDSLINSAEVRVVHFESAERCAPAQGELEVSGTYDLAFPLAGGDRRVFDVNLAQRIPAGEPDVFSLRIRLAGAAEALKGFNGDSRLYLLEILLHHDKRTTPLAAGRAVVALPFPGSHQFADVGGAGAFGGIYFDPECPSRNLRRLRRTLALSGSRSDELEQFATNPSAYFGFNPPAKPLEPTQRDRSMAITAAAQVAEAMASGEFEAACKALDFTATLLLERASNVPCVEWLRSLALSQSAEPRLRVIESHAGWQKVVATTVGPESTRLILIVQLVRAAKPRWVVTNVYDASEGPLDLTYENDRSR